MDEDKKVDGPSEEELEELIRQLKELEKEAEEINKKKRKGRGFFTIEFGGVYHPNRIVNFLFSLLINISLSYTIISVFNFADFISIYYFFAFMVIYTSIEWFIRDYIISRYIQYVIKTFGMVFYFSYLILLFMLDQFLFVGNFTFKHETHVVAFLTIFVIVRYIIGTALRRYFRRQLLR